MRNLRVCEHGFFLLFILTAPVILSILHYKGSVMKCGHSLEKWEESGRAGQTVNLRWISCRTDTKGRLAEVR